MPMLASTGGSQTADWLSSLKEVRVRFMTQCYVHFTGYIYTKHPVTCTGSCCNGTVDAIVQPLNHRSKRPFPYKAFHQNVWPASPLFSLQLSTDHGLLPWRGVGFVYKNEMAGRGNKISDIVMHTFLNGCIRVGRDPHRRSRPLFCMGTIDRIGVNCVSTFTCIDSL